MSKTFFIDTSRCTACRGCQLACKEWHELPPNKTLQWGSHQNPPDLNPNNYKLVRFSEHLVHDQVRWYFFPDQCRHCINPPCKLTADMILEGAIVQDAKTGAVLFTDLTKRISQVDFEDVRASCPYDIPRRDEKTGLINKCTMCFNRINQGMLPACVKVCPTGTMNFGERDEMLALAEKRLKEVKKDSPDAMLADPGEVNVIFLLLDDPKKYHLYSVADASAKPMDRKGFLATLAKPFQGALREIAKG